MPFTELEAHASKTDMDVRAALLRLIALKAEVREELGRPDLSVLEEERLKSHLSEIASAIQQYRFSGSF